MADSQNQEPLDGEMIAMNIIASATAIDFRPFRLLSTINKNK